jgi:hypothetical protein
VPVTVGLDFGRQPAASIGQMLRNDWFIQREYIGRDMSAVEFAPLLKTYLAQQYPGFTFNFWGDPAGQHRGEATDKTPFQVFSENGMKVLPAPNPQNMRSIRWEAVNGVLMRRSQTGRPSSLLIDPGCVTLITGLSGGYFMRRLRISGERYADEPDKNQYSHVCEAFENQLLGGGEGRAVTMGSHPDQKPVNGLEPAQDDAAGVVREVPAFGIEARRWTVVFPPQGRELVLRRDRDGRVQACVGLRVHPRARHLDDLRRRLSAHAAGAPGRYGPRQDDPGQHRQGQLPPVTVETSDEHLPLMRAGLFCTTAVKHLIGVRSGALRPSTAVPPPRREGGVVRDDGSREATDRKIRTLLRSRRRRSGR